MGHLQCTVAHGIERPEDENTGARQQRRDQLKGWVLGKEANWQPDKNPRLNSSIKIGTRHNNLRPWECPLRRQSGRIGLNLCSE
jgi:hypothetical protein